MKKLYIIVNNKSKAEKGKIARACSTVGLLFGLNNNTSDIKFLLSGMPTIVVKGEEFFDRYLEKYSKENKVFGIHCDAGKTQVKNGTILAFGIYEDEKEMRGFKLY
jgi:peptidyl-tRNA hydrolase